LSFAGKNAYAMSVLKQIEKKIDGRDIVDNRYLLSQSIQITFIENWR